MTSEEYVGASAAKIIGKRLEPVSLLGSIKATYLLEERRGDGELGPQDSAVFMYVRIDPGQREAWARHLAQPASETPRFVRPRFAPKWWPREDPLPSARLVGAPTLLRGAAHGWAMLSADGEHVYLYSYTK